MNDRKHEHDHPLERCAACDLQGTPDRPRVRLATETFYEAAVMLAVFLLFGLWMEMKAPCSSDSVRKLLDLAPKRATVERDGKAVDVPVAEVAVGDVVILKPGDSVPVDGEVLRLQRYRREHGDGRKRARGKGPWRSGHRRNHQPIRISAFSSGSTWARTPHWRRSYDSSKPHRTARRQHNGWQTGPRII